VNAILYYFGEKPTLSNIGGALRPGIVHRLDKDTSGVLLIAKNNKAHENIIKKFSEKKVIKTYEAIVRGAIHIPEGLIDKPIARSKRNRKKFTVSQDGRPAVTAYTMIDSKKDTTWVRLFPKTGRTHQLRVHLAHIGHPILGDPLYSRKSYPVPYIALVAKELCITHPSTGKDMLFSAPYPEHFKSLAAELGYVINGQER